MTMQQETRQQTCISQRTASKRFGEYKKGG
jgi:hypothetical protein